MPFAPQPLPSELGDEFLARDVELHRISLGRLRRSDLDRSVWGVRAPHTVSADLARRCRMFQLRLPHDAFFSGATAALLLEVPLPYELETDELDVTVPSPMRSPHAKGISGHSRQVLASDIIETNGVRHSAPPRLWCELAGRLELGDLVAAGDHLIDHRRALATRADLAARLTTGDRITRSRRLRAALPLLHERSESRPESRLRLILALGGLPAPQINHTTVLCDSGRYVRPDFRFPRERVILEYQGDYHRTKRQWRADMTRRSRLEAVGWVVVELNADDLKQPVELCARVGAILRRAT